MSDASRTHNVTTTLGETRKSILRSKTFWLQMLALGAAFFPGVQAWIAANPVDAVGVLAAANVIVRFITSGQVTLFSEEVDGGSSGGVMLLLGMGTAVGIMGALPSCTASQVEALRGVPVRIGIEGRDAAASYSSKGGLVISARVRGTK